MASLSIVRKRQGVIEIYRCWSVQGRLKNLELQKAFILAESVKFENEPRRKPAVKYVADFVYREKGQLVVEDVKSKMTRSLPVYRLKKHLMKSVHGLEIREI